MTGDLGDEVARYRLALLGAAHAAEGIAADLANDGHKDYAKRCAGLSRQMNWSLRNQLRQDASLSKQTADEARPRGDLRQDRPLIVRSVALGEAPSWPGPWSPLLGTCLARSECECSHLSFFRASVCEFDHG